MTWWRAVYDVQTRFCHAFGRVLFLRAPTPAEAAARVRRYVAISEPDGTVTRVALRPSTSQARRRQWQWVQAHRAWKANAARGILNRGNLIA